MLRGVSLNKGGRSGVLERMIRLGRRVDRHRIATLASLRRLRRYAKPTSRAISAGAASVPALLSRESAATGNLQGRRRSGRESPFG